MYDQQIGNDSTFSDHRNGPGFSWICSVFMGIGGFHSVDGFHKYWRFSLQGDDGF